MEAQSDGKVREDNMNFSLDCPTPECEGKLSYARAKTSSDKSIRIWERKCNICGVVVTDSAIFSREIQSADFPKV